MTTNDKKAIELQALLLGLRDELLAVTNDASGSTDTVELDQAMVGRLSRMDAIQHQEMAKAQKRRAEERLVQVQTRLMQFATEDEAFGACSDCLEPIPWPRLQALPDAELCVPCLQHRQDA